MPRLLHFVHFGTVPNQPKVLQFRHFGIARQISLRRHVTYTQCGGDSSQGHPLPVETDHTGDPDHVGSLAGNRFSRNSTFTAL